MTFQQPLLLLLLLLLPLAAGAVWLWRRRRPPAGVPFPDLDLIAAADPGPRRRRHLPLALALLALTGFVFALARPMVDRQVPRERATIMLAIDVSGSMAATDVSPYRLRAAQDAAERFIREVPAQFQIGLLSFSGQANLIVAPTTDRAAMRRGIESLVPEGATAIGDAIEASLEAIRGVQGATGADAVLRSARIVMLSDGATTVGTAPEVAAQDAQRVGVPIYTVALGTPDGVLSNGQPVPPDPAGLKTIADISGGKAYATTDAQSVSDVYGSLGSFIGTQAMPSEVTAWPAGIAVALLIMAGVAAWRLSPRLS